MDNLEGGSGGDSTLNAREVRMIEKAVRNRWLIPERAFYSLPEKMLEVVESPDSSERAVVAAARTMAVMHGQNEAADTEKTPAVQINVGVQVVQREDFYGNAERLRITQARAAGALPASTDGAQEPGAVQAAGLRPTVGQNGNGAHRGANGTRPDGNGQADVPGGD